MNSRKPAWSPWPTRATRAAPGRRSRTGERTSPGRSKKPTAPTRNSARRASGRTRSSSHGKSSASSAAAPGAPGNSRKPFTHWRTDLDPKTGWSGGFSCVIGNPPWERVKLQEQEFFASRNPKIANAPNAAARKKRIAALADTDPALYHEFQNELRKASGWSYFLRESGRYPADRPRRHEHLRRLRRNRPHGHRSAGPKRLGPATGIATEVTTAPFFGDLVPK